MPAVDDARPGGWLHALAEETGIPPARTVLGGFSQGAVMSYDPVISVEFARRAMAMLEGAGGEVVYRESPLPHTIDPRFLEELRPWLRAAVDRAAGPTAAQRTT